MMLASKSLPSLLSIDKLIENESFSKESLLKKPEKTLCDMGTQTQTTVSSCSSIGQDSEEFEENSCSPTRNQLSSDSLSTNTFELKLVKKKIPILKHQLTRDSGIDSDNAQQKLIRPKKQIVLSNRDDNSGEKEDSDERRGSVGLATVSSTKRPSSGIKSLTIKTSSNNEANSSPSKLYLMSSCTRDSSMDFGEPNSSSLEDLGIDHSNSNSNSHSNDLVDEDDEIMLNLFKRNVHDDDESEGKTKDSNENNSNNNSDDQFDESYDYNKQQRRSFDAASNKRRIFKSN